MSTNPSFRFHKLRMARFCRDNCTSFVAVKPDEVGRLFQGLVVIPFLLLDRFRLLQLLIRCYGLHPVPLLATNHQAQEVFIRQR